MATDYSNRSVITVYIVGIEIAVQSIGALKISMDTLDARYAVTQLLVLISGMMIYGLSTVFAYKKAAANFRKGRPVRHR